MNSQLKRVYRHHTQEHTSVEEQLYDIKHKTVPQHESSTWRNPLNNQQPWYEKAPKQYTEVEHIQHQLIFKENYHKKLPFMADALLVLKKIMESEKKE
jgi:hypothetical protein